MLYIEGKIVWELPRSKSQENISRSINTPPIDARDITPPGVTKDDSRITKCQPQLKGAQSGDCARVIQRNERRTPLKIKTPIPPRARK